MAGESGAQGRQPAAADTINPLQSAFEDGILQRL
jgi:hypothetical protein